MTLTNEEREALLAGLECKLSGQSMPVSVEGARTRAELAKRGLYAFIESADTVDYYITPLGELALSFDAVAQCAGVLS